MKLLFTKPTLFDVALLISKGKDKEAEEMLKKILKK